MKTQPDIFKPISDLIEAETRAVDSFLSLYLCCGLCVHLTIFMLWAVCSHPGCVRWCGGEGPPRTRRY